MQSKLIRSLLLIAILAVPLKVTSMIREVGEKNQAMTQFNNSEVDYQILKNIQHIEYLDYFVIVIGAFAMFAIWKPKKQTKETDNESA
jgi:hypothetical protein